MFCIQTRRWRAFQEEQLSKHHELLERAVVAEKKAEVKERSFILMEANWKDSSNQLDIANSLINELHKKNNTLEDEVG